MELEPGFFKTVWHLALPIALQSVLQASFSVVDQIMIGQLGSVQVAGVGLAGKFASIFTVLVSAVAAVAGIMLAQYLGQRQTEAAARAFTVNLAAAAAAALFFTVVCLLFPQQVMGLYTKDFATCQAAAAYLSILALSFLPAAGTTLLSALFRCLGRPSLPLYAGMAAALLNTVLNYILIFGRLGFAPMGANGAALATVIAQLAGFLLLLGLYARSPRRLPCRAVWEDRTFAWKQYGAMLLPILLCEWMWSLGENVYAAIYGHLGTDACAAMTLTNPIQALMTGALCGLAQAAGVIIGNRLGTGETEQAYLASKKLLWYGLGGSLLLSLILLLTRVLYVNIYRVEPAVKALTQQVLTVYALIAPFKIQNMILGGGILRSGGKTHLVMWIDLIGTWGFGVPLGLLAAFVLHLSIPYVYLFLSLEECVRFGISLVALRKRSWMRRLET